jgi:hypothetical protein
MWRLGLLKLSRSIVKLRDKHTDLLEKILCGAPRDDGEGI